MSSRPQFSLRLLLFVTAMVALAAATARSPRPRSEASVSSGVVRIQAYLRLAECLLFPAIFTALAVAKGGRSRTFCLGAIVPAIMPMLAVCYYTSALWQNPFSERASSVIGELNWVSFELTDRITAL